MKSAVIIFEMLIPNSDSSIDDPAISVIAMGIGSKLPLVISIFKSARTSEGRTNVKKSKTRKKYRKTEDLFILKTYP